MLNPEHSITSKTLPNGLTATLTLQTDPPHPRRDEDHITTITAWHPSISLSDKRHHATSPRDFLLDIAWETHGANQPTPLPGNRATYRQLSRYVQENYRGVLRELHMHLHSATLLSTTPFGIEPDSGQVGFVHITRESMDQHRLDNTLATRAIESEIRHLQDYINGSVYSLALEKDGETVDSINSIYASPPKPSLDQGIWTSNNMPSDEELDIWLSCMNLSEEDLQAITEVQWTTI